MDGKFKVSTKAALFNRNGTKVLVIDMDDHGYGIPGGHMHYDEQPDDAMARELYEEIGAKDVTVEKKSFFKHANGKVILAYTGMLDDAVKFNSTQEKSEGDPIWVTCEQFSDLRMDPGYKRFVLANWPS